MGFIKSHIILVVYILVILIGILANYIVFYTATPVEDNAVILNPEDFKNGEQTLKYHKLSKDDEKRLSFSAAIDRPELESLTDAHYSVLVSHLNCQAYNIYFNDVFLGSVGDMQDGDSNIWNSTNHFNIDRQLVKDNNILRIDTLSDYQRGFDFAPVYILAQSSLHSYLDINRYFSEGISFFAFGMAVFGAISAFMLYLISFPKNSSFLAFSFALLFYGFYTLDYTLLCALPIDYLIYKKLVMASLYICVSLASLGMYKYFHNKTDFVMCVATISGYAIIAFFTPDMITFDTLYQYYNFVIIANMISWVLTSQKHFRKTDEAKMFFFGTALLLVFCFSSIFSTLTGKIVLFNSPFVFSLVFSMIATILFFREFIHKDMQIQIVNNAHRESYQASITDGMTGVFNHRYLTHVLHRTNPPFSVAMIDIDNFKHINDTYGHRFGDEIIRHIATNLSSQVRNTDSVFRYGGDEFFIIFPGCSAENAKEVMLKIKRKIDENIPEHENKQVPVTFSGGIYYVATLQDLSCIFDRVDNPLYKSKKEGKDRITIYSSLSHEL